MSLREGLSSGMPDHFTMSEEFPELAGRVEEIGYALGNCGCIADAEIHDTADIRLLGGGERVPWPEGYLPSNDRLWEVGDSGGDGSTCCLWLDDDGRQHAVHHGSGSGSCLWTTFPSALPVLRLFAVGYFSPANNDEWDAPPEDGDFPTDQATVNAALRPYRDWLREHWGQGTPTTGVEALRLSPVEAEIRTDFNGPTKGDPFHEWLGAGARSGTGSRS